MLASELRGRADLDHLALADRQALVGERVVFATPVAMSGLMDMERFKGLALAVVTDTALHVFERGGRHFRTPWELVTKVDVAKAKFGRLLRLGSGSTQVEVLYLTDAQIQTIRGLASRHSSKVLGVGGDTPALVQEKERREGEGWTRGRARSAGGQRSDAAILGAGVRGVPRVDR